MREINVKIPFSENSEGDNTMALAHFIEIPCANDLGGLQSDLESQAAVPFDIKRVYYIFGTKAGVSRGFHAHKSLKQVAVCISGKCLMRLDDGQHVEEVWLDSPKKGLLIEDMVWREMHCFSPDCVLLVLASEFFSEADYIRNYEKFLKMAVYTTTSE